MTPRRAQRGTGARGHSPDRVDERVVQLDRQVVAHAGDQQQLRARDRARRWPGRRRRAPSCRSRPWMTSAGTRELAQPRVRSGWVRIATICRATPAGADAAVPGLRRARRGRPRRCRGRPASRSASRTGAELATYASRVVARRSSSRGSSRGSCQPTRAAAGGGHDRGQRAAPARGAAAPSSARSCRPSRRRPRARRRCPRWSSSPKASSAMSSSVYGGRRRGAADEAARTSCRRVTRPVDPATSGRCRGCRSGSRRSRASASARQNSGSHQVIGPPRPITSSSGSPAGSPKVW